MTTASDILKSKPDQTVSYHHALGLGVRRSQADGGQKHRQFGGDGGRECRRHDYRARLRTKNHSDGTSSKDTPVRDIMTSSVMYVRPGHTSEECMMLMTENRLRHLPVMDDGKMIGIISIGDLVKDIISEQKFIIQQPEHYITGERS